MKVSAQQVAATLKATDRLAGLLIFGEDWGLVRSRAQVACRAVLGEDRGPFRLTNLAREDHGRLFDEAGNLALGGGRRVVHVAEAGDALAPVLARMRIRPADLLVVMEAGDLSARSKLRLYAEKEAGWAAIACHAGNSSQVAAEIRAALSAAGLSPTPDALAFLAAELAGDSLTRRSELDKLVLFASGEQTVDLEMASLCCAASLDTSIGAAVSAALSGQADQCDGLLQELERDGATGPGLLAVLSLQVHRLLRVRLLMESGQSAEEACRSLLPPLYPRQMKAMVHDAGRWRTDGLEMAGRAIRQADIACKRAASPDFAIAARLVMALASRSPARP